MSQTVPVIGRFVARQTGVVAARVAGALGEFRVDVGDRVAEGDLIAVLLKERLQWEYNLKQAEVANFAAQVRTKERGLKLLQQELERLRSLKNSPAFSQARLDDKLQEVAVAESGAAEAEARLRMANASLRLAGISLHDAEVRAPYAGVVTKRHAEVGAYVGIGAPVVTIVDDKNMEIEADVPASRTGGLTPDTIVAAIIDGTTRIDAAVRAVIPEENPRTRTRAVRFIPAFGNASSKVADNQSVTLLVPAGESRDVITVHKDA
ncbi:MAG: efflux RND transporter periplasmic adaptor subunit, partial [Rhodospirillaceae bacterium]